MSLSIYLYFDGNCKEAFDHYKKVFNAPEICRQHYSDAPPNVFDDQSNERIMHTTLMVGGIKLMGSDREASCEEAIVAGNNFCVTYHPSSESEADDMFSRLAEGGNITMPLEKTFWGSYFGLCTDQWGVNWMFNMPLEQEKE